MSQGESGVDAMTLDHTLPAVVDILFRHLLFDLVQFLDEFRLAAMRILDMDRERADWLYSYNPLTVPLATP